MSDVEGYLTQKKIESIVDLIDYPRDKTIFMVLWRTGCRVGELVQLKWEMIHFDEDIMFIPTEKKRRWTQRVFPMDDDLIGTLRRWRELQEINGNLRSEWVFPSGYRLNRWPITTERVRQIVEKWGTKAGIPKVGRKKIHPHHFRHSFAIHLVKKGIDIRRVQMLLGHENLETTSVYLQFDIKDIKEGMEKVWE